MTVTPLVEQQALQATQFIIDLFESSKAQSEDALDNLSNIYAVLTESGEILKGNRRLADYYEVSHELVLGRNISEILQPEGFQIFVSTVQRLVAEALPSLDFRANTQTKKKAQQTHIWYLSPLTSKRKDIPKIFILLGHDITELIRTTQQNTRMQTELQTAREIQESLLPKPEAQFDHSLIAGYYESASECGGDWWHYGLIGDRLYLWIGDVTGHGVGAALLTSAVNSLVSFIETNKTAPTPKETLNILNQLIFRPYNSEKNMTLLAISVDLVTGKLTYSSAGHPSAILVSTKENNKTHAMPRALKAKASVPIGAEENVIYEDFHDQLLPGDRLLLYTDGLKDIVNSEGARFGENNYILRKMLPQIMDTFPGANDLVKEIARIANEFREKTPLEDDVTLMIFQYHPSTQDI